MAFWFLWYNVFMGRFFVSVAIFLFFAFPYNADAEALGNVKIFYTDPSFSEDGKTQAVATLRYISERAYFYVDNSYFDALRGQEGFFFMNFIKELAREYDNNIYPKLTEKFGSIREPGIDNDPKIYVLLLPLKENVGGYINTADGYPKERIEDGRTNQKEIVYLNINSKRENLKAFLAHELQHLITFNQKDIKRKVSDDVWLNELRSEYALDVLGYNLPYQGSFLQERVRRFLKNPWDSLVEWKNESYDYASVSLLGQYIAGYFSDDIFKKMLQSENIGIKSINDALSGYNFSGTFKDLFLNWQIANYLNDASFYGKEYGYQNENLNFKINPKIFHKIEKKEQEFSYLVKDWQISFVDYEFNSPFLGIEVLPEKKDNKFSIAYVLNKFDGTKTISKFNLEGDSKNIAIDNSKNNVKSVTLFILSRKKTGGFSDNEPKRKILVKVKPSQTKDIFFASDSVLVNFPDGSLIRPAWDFKVYVVKGKYIRHIPNPKILSFYKGDVKIVTREEFDNLKESKLIKKEGDFKVYEVDKSGTLHWLDMTAEEFRNSGRSFDAVFEVTEEEFLFYNIGNKITK